jgi:hypothetical protein
MSGNKKNLTLGKYALQGIEKFSEEGQSLTITEENKTFPSKPEYAFLKTKYCYVPRNVSVMIACIYHGVPIRLYCLLTA